MRRNHRTMGDEPLNSYQQSLHDLLHGASTCQQDVWHTPQGPMVTDALGAMLEYNGGNQFYANDAEREANGGDQNVWAKEHSLFGQDDNQGIKRIQFTTAIDDVILNVGNVQEWHSYTGAPRHDHNRNITPLNDADGPLSLRWSPGQMAVLVAGFMRRLNLFDYETALFDYIRKPGDERRTMIWHQFASWKGWRLLAQSPTENRAVTWDWDDRLGEAHNSPCDATFVLLTHLQKFAKLPFGEYIYDLLHGSDGNLHLHCTGDDDHPTIMAYDGIFHITPFIADIAKQVDGMFQHTALPQQLDDLLAMQRMVPTIQGVVPVDSRFLMTSVTSPTPESERQLEQWCQRNAAFTDCMAHRARWSWCISSTDSLLRMIGWVPGPDGTNSLTILNHISDANLVDAEVVCRCQNDGDTSKVFTVDLIEQASDGPHTIPIVDVTNGVSISDLMDGDTVLDTWRDHILQAHQSYLEEHHE